MADEIIFPEDKVLWTPKFADDNAEFRVMLDFEFAKRMQETTISAEDKDRLQSEAYERFKKFGLKQRTPYRFDGESGLVSGVYTDDRAGIWLATNLDERNRLIKGEEKRPIKYWSHNVDGSTSDAVMLQRIFGLWINYSDVLTE